MRFSDRTDAGRLLGMRLAETAWINPVVYALPRGGVPVGLEVAKALNAPLDLLLVRKIGVPWQRELAAASVIDGDQPDIVFNEHVLHMTGISHDQILQAAKPELREIERRRILYLKGQAPISAKGRDAILVDDGIATGASLRAAIKSVRKRYPLRVIIAAPVASLDTAESLRQLADEVICLSTPPNFYAIGPHYDDFHQLSDEEVVGLLKQRPETEEAESVSTN
jgi:putative phosphoribosyl transferase